MILSHAYTKRKTNEQLKKIERANERTNKRTNEFNEDERRRCRWWQVDANAITICTDGLHGEAIIIPVSIIYTCVTQAQHYVHMHGERALS